MDGLGCSCREQSAELVDGESSDSLISSRIDLSAAIRFDEVSDNSTVRSRRRIASTTPGTPPPVPTSRIAFVGLHEWAYGSSINHISLNKLLYVSMPGKIKSIIPRP